MCILSGMMFCADCGAKLCQIRGKVWTHDKEYFVCATDRKKRYVQFVPDTKCCGGTALLEDLRRVMSFAKDHEQGFIRVVMNNLEKELAKELSLNQKGYEQAQGRIITLDKIIQKLYEDMCWVKSRRNVFTRWRLNMKPNRKLLRQRWLC